MIILVAILGFLVGLVVSHHYIVVPCWGTEAGLRKELKEVRGELYLAKHGRPQRKWKIAIPYGLFADHPLNHKASANKAVPHRTHSDVLPFDSVDALIEGTK